MQPEKSSRINLGELKVQIVKRIGADKSKRYFYYLNRFLSQKLSKSEFDKLCFRALGRENIPLHNHFIKSILKNACHAKTPPTVQPSGPTKSRACVTDLSPGTEGGHVRSVANGNFQNHNVSVLSNGVLPASPRKLRSGIRDRKLKDRPSPLGPNGKVDSVAHQSAATEYSGGNVDMDNGTLTPCDYQRPTQPLHAMAELPKNAMTGFAEKPIHAKGLTEISTVEDGEEVEQLNRLRFNRNHLIAPLGIPYCSASVGGARKALPVNITGDFVGCCDSNMLYDTDTLRMRLEQIAMVQGLESVSTECASMLNTALDVYLKRLIKSSVDLVGARSANEPTKLPITKQQIQRKVINGILPNNHLHVHSTGRMVEPEPEYRPQIPVSLHDFKVAMELNPQQLGGDWPLQLEKISIQSFKE